MPVIDSNAKESGQRTTFRPPWVRESGPVPLPMPSAPWTHSKAADGNDSKAAGTQPRKQSKITIIPSKASIQGKGNIGESSGEQQARPKETSVPIKIESRVTTKREDKGRNGNEKPTIVVKKETLVPIIGEKQPPSEPRQENRKMSEVTPTRPTPPPPPPPPPPMSSSGTKKVDSQPVSPEKAAKLEALRSRPRRRPDWTDMMKEVEGGAKLKHVRCDDRSAPILPSTKAKGQFVYESEKKDNNHNKLLKQIQTGVKLKKVRTNDRSRPNLDGLRKFRRQMTIEEQIQKSTSVADVVALAAEPDELDDIDKVRDDLQCAKQMLALELRNKEGLERENKRLMARLLNLEVELEKEKNVKKVEAEKGTAVVQVRTEKDEKLIQKLKEESSDATKVAKEMEEKYQKIAEELDSTRAKLESAWLRNQQLELQLKAAEKESVVAAGLGVLRQPSSKKLAASMASMPNGRASLVPSDEDSDYEEETQTEESDDDEDNDKDTDAAKERRLMREFKLLNNKLRSFKDKVKIAHKERQKLRELIKKQQRALKEEKKKYRLLQKEVDKMAKLMKDEVDEDDDADDDNSKGKTDEESETESDDSEESEEEEEEESEVDEPPEDVSQEEKKRHLSGRVRKYENRLSSLKKGNYLMKANIDRLQDDLNRQKEMSITLQEDLNSVLEELG